jgi:tRNA-specific 2-thiouridylase
MPKVIVGMSGGVDSSVTAYLLKQQGYEVEGVSLNLWEARNRSDFTACCSLDAAASAARTAESLGIKHSSSEVRQEFIEKVITPFVESYLKGLTPNPCILCNQYIKFPFLLKEAEKRGAEFIATGHYARTRRHAHPDNLPSALMKGSDPKKDQSYVLYVLTQNELGKLLLPLGDYTKKDIREMARLLNLEAADRPESQEICFIEDNNYAGFIEELSPEAGKPGPIMDMKGRTVGTHKGIFRYTIGQRKGLGIASLVPHYVIRIDTANNTVFAGSQEDAKTREIIVSGLNLLLPLAGRIRATVKVRSMMADKPADIEFDGEKVRVIFDEPQWAPAPGQSAVFYDGDTVLGGGMIESCVYPDFK